MAPELIANHRENAEIVTGAAACKRKVKELFKKFSLPSGLVPIDDDVVEIGYNSTTSFFWVIRKKKKEHTFRSINRKAIYDTESTAFLGERRMRKATGVKTKELLIWISLCDVRIDDLASGKLTCTTPAGLTKTFPISAFEEEEDEEEEENNVEQQKKVEEDKKQVEKEEIKKKVEN